MVLSHPGESGVPPLSLPRRETPRKHRAETSTATGIRTAGLAALQSQIPMFMRDRGTLRPAQNRSTPPPNFIRTSLGRGSLAALRRTRFQLA
jgi:hypothetical protein